MVSSSWDCTISEHIFALFSAHCTAKSISIGCPFAHRAWKSTSHHGWCMHCLPEQKDGYFRAAAEGRSWWCHVKLSAYGTLPPSLFFPLAQSGKERMQKAQHGWAAHRKKKGGQKSSSSSLPMLCHSTLRLHHILSPSLHTCPDNEAA